MRTRVHVGHLTAAETECDLHAVSLCEKLAGSVDLCLQIIGVDVGRKPDLLDLDNVLLALRVLFLAGLFVLVFSVINFAFGEILTRSRFASSASLSASLEDIMPSCSPSAEITRTSLSRILSLMNNSSLSLSLLFTFIASTRPGAKKQWRKAPLSHTCLSSSARIALTMLPVIPGSALQHIQHKME